MPAQTTAPPPSPINHVLVDFENVHQIDLSVIGAKSVFFTLLIGAKQKRLDTELVEKLMVHAASVELVRLTSSGKNALDFALAYHLGRVTITDPSAYFHIISKDKGFDPLIEQMKARGLRALRHDDFSTLTFTFRPKEKPAATANGELQARVLAHLRKNPRNRPKRRKTLESHLESFTGNNGTKVEVSKLIQTLISAGHIRIGDKGSVSYSL